MEKFKVEIWLDAYDLEALGAEVAERNELAKTIDWDELGIRHTDLTIEDELILAMRMHVYELKEKLAARKQAEEERGYERYEDGSGADREAVAAAGGI